VGAWWREDVRNSLGVSYHESERDASVASWLAQRELLDEVLFFDGP
jgi:hypothetical protein